MRLMGILFRHLRPTEKQGGYMVPVVSPTVNIEALATDLKALLESTEKQTLSNFYSQVCDQAERNMESTGTVSGAHWNAMRKVLNDKGIEVTR